MTIIGELRLMHSVSLFRIIQEGKAVFQVIFGRILVVYVFTRVNNL